jgi:hypothetical protein
MSAPGIVSSVKMREPLPGISPGGIRSVTIWFPPAFNESTSDDAACGNRQSGGSVADKRDTERRSSIGVGFVSKAMGMNPKILRSGDNRNMSHPEFW